MKIFITGATGFVGATLTRYFAKSGKHEVVALGRTPNPPKQLLDVATYQQFDLSQKKNKILEGDVIIHAAALADDGASYEDLYAANVVGTANLTQMSAGCGTFVLISSSSVYSFRNNLPKKENEAGNDFQFLTNYGKTKWLSEKMLNALPNPQQKRLILRPRAIYGVGDRVILPRLLDMVRGNYFIMPTAMNVLTSQTHVSQLSFFIDHFLNQKELSEPLYTFNIADKTPYLMGDSIHQLLNTLTDKKLNPKIIPLSVLNFLATTGLSKKVTKFLIDAVTHDCVLDLKNLQNHYTIPETLNLNAESEPLKNWIDRQNGITQYLRQKNDAPWIL